MIIIRSHINSTSWASFLIIAFKLYSEISTFFNELIEFLKVKLKHGKYRRRLCLWTKILRKNFKKQEIGNIKVENQEQALKEGFNKIVRVERKFCILFYSRGGKSKKPKGEGKRSKPSKQIGKDYFKLIIIFITIF